MIVAQGGWEFGGGKKQWALTFFSSGKGGSVAAAAAFFAAVALAVGFGCGERAVISAGAGVQSRIGSGLALCLIFLVFCSLFSYFSLRLSLLSLSFSLLIVDADLLRNVVESAQRECPGLTYPHAVTVKVQCFAVRCGTVYKTVR